MRHAHGYSLVHCTLPKQSGNPMSAVFKTSLYAPSKGFLPRWGQDNGAEQREEGSLITNARDGRHAVGLCRTCGGLITAMQEYKAGFWLLGFGLRGLPLR